MGIMSYEELIKDQFIDRLDYLEVENRFLRKENETLTKENKAYKERFEINITEEEMEQQYRDYYSDTDQY